MDRSLRALLTSASLSLFATGASAYPAPVDFDGSLLRWAVGLGSEPITYGVEADREEDLLAFGPAIDEAAALWTNVPTSYFAYRRAEEGETPQVTVHLKSTLAGSAYSAGYALFDEFDGTKPRHCVIYVVVEDGLSYVAMGKTFLHELGHCAGLGHTLIPEAIMSYSLDKNGFRLDIDDEAAVTRLYPADGSAPKLPPGCAAGAATQKGRPLSLVLALALPLALAWRRSIDRSPARDR